MAALSEKNLEGFEKQSGGLSLRANRRNSIASRRSSDSGPGPVPMGRRLSRSLGGAHREGAHVGLKSAMSSSTAISHSKPRVQHENTYRMAPESQDRFLPFKCAKFIDQILDAHLDGARYETATVGILTKRISEDLKFRVKEMKIPRYKIVCQVFIGSKGAQSLQMASRALWDDKTDSHVSRSFENESLFAVATVHCTYFE
ncbi:dynein light chain Tctex-type 5-like [Amphiura filiformis]|uniref:dynein light chain Tctex-type 5-like n=1 Tax=Amphiura filiformis TaxID=82378 RepID=UPI003B22447B